MDRATELYQEFIDAFAEKSKKCAAREWVLNGEAKGSGEKYNAFLKKLSAEDRKTLAEFVERSYFDGIYAALTELEWYIDCRDMKISVEDEELPVQQYEGLGNDFVGRASGEWNWDE